MFSFKKKKNSVAPSSIFPDNNEFQKATESLYKQNLEIANKNKTLSLLSKLYEISIQALPPQELGEKITKTIQENFDFELVGVLLYDEKKDALSSLAFAESKRFKRVEESHKTFFENFSIENTSSHSPFLAKVMGEKTFGYTEDPSELWGDRLSKEMYDRIQSDGHVRSSLAFPLITEGKTIGLSIISLNRDYEHLATYEKDSIHSFTNLIVIALDKALLYEALKIANAKLEVANKQLENLVHFVSHEVKGALGKNRIVFNEIAENADGSISSEMSDLARQADHDTKKTVEMVMDILNSSDLQSGKVLMMMNHFDMRDAVLEAVKDAQKEAQVKGIYLETDIREGADWNIIGDREKIVQHVTRNLIENSIKYTPKGGLTVSLKRNDNKILFSVKDTGVGLSENDKKVLFTEGGKGENSTKINVHSTGYGLFYAKGIVEAHKGRIWAESEGAGKGSTFFVELPVVKNGTAK